MSELERFHDLLFEISNEYRHGILLLVQKKAMRVTDISKELNLTYPEIRRHISRLQDVGLVQRDVEGYYQLTPYGESSLFLLQELIFLSVNREYFLTHTIMNIPVEFIKRIGELSESVSISSPIDFFRYNENLLKGSKEYVWLLVNQFPLNLLSTIVGAVDRGVKLRIIEPIERVLNPDLEAITSEETQALSRARHTPLVEQRMVDDVNVYLFISDARCVLAFPTRDFQYDFKGFTARDESSLRWCNELFMNYWEEARERIISPETKIIRGRFSRKRVSNKVLVIGQDRSEIDAQAVQDAVDNYSEVTLRGTFNFGSSSVLISRSVTIKGEDRENNIPLTTIYKKGWNFPFTEFDSVLKVDGEGIKVKIENLNFTDFNHVCIFGVRCGSLDIKDNRITLMTGYGRGMTYGAFGDVVIGIWIRGTEPSLLKSRISIEGNFIDFARGGAFGGFLTRGGLEETPEYRPNLFNHEYYMGFGIGVHQVSGDITIKSNTIKNTNARGIAVTDCLQTADVKIRNNTITSDVYGSYPFSSPEAGAGILTQSAWGFPSPGFDVEIEENTIDLDKLNYCGIMILGPVIDREGVGKISYGTIRNNNIKLKKGYEGIHVRKCDNLEITGNSISGSAYYGIRVSGRRGLGELDLRALNNKFEDNTMANLNIRKPDYYSNNHADGRMFTSTQNQSTTAYVWLDKFTKNNLVRVKNDESVIDEGENNTIVHEYPE